MNRLNLYRRIAAVSLTFSMVMAGLLISLHLSRPASPALPFQGLNKLRAELQESPTNDVLRGHIRKLDLELRKRHFRAEVRLHLGAILLGVGITIFILAMTGLTWSRRSFPRLDKAATVPHADRESLQTYLSALAGGIVLAMIAGTMVWLREPPFPAVAAAVPEPDKPDPTGAPKGPDRQTLAANWVSFRGLDSLGICQRNNPPTRWSAKEGIRWKVKIRKPGFSSPVVFDKKLFLTGGDKKMRFLYAFDAETGALLWAHAADKIPGSPKEPPEVTEDTGFAAPTVTTDGARVAAIFATGDMVCTDFAGKRLWARNLGVPENHYAHSSSLLSWRGLVFVQYDHSGEQSIRALDFATGKTTWQTDRESDISWSSPVLVDGDKEDAFLVINAAPLVAAYRARDGKELWKNECMSGEVGPSPAVLNGVVYVANDGASLVALDAKTGKTLWENDEPIMPDAASPLVTEACVFLPNGLGSMTGLDPKSGKVLWEQDFKKGFYTSPVLVGKKIYLTDLDGITYILESGPDYKEMARLPLGEPVAATPAFVGDRMYLRGWKHLYCIGPK